MDNDVLIHHGIKGMKWGVRRTPAQLGHKVMGSLLKNRVKTSKDSKSSKAGKPTKSGKLTKAGKLSKDMDKLSDKELRQRLNRAKMEMEVSELAAKEKRANRSWVVNALEDTAKTSAKNIATNQATKYGNKFVDMAIEKAPSVSEKARKGISNKAKDIVDRHTYADDWERSAVTERGLARDDAIASIFRKLV